MEKNKAAVELGRLGGLARNKPSSQKRKIEISRMGGLAREKE